MKFNDVVQSGVVLEVGAEKIRIPPFTIQDYADWCAELDAERRKEHEEALALLPPEKRFQAKLAYRVLRTDINEVAALVFVPEGLQRVVSTCFGRAVVIDRDGRRLEPPEPLPPERAAAIRDANVAQLYPLAKLLAGIHDEDRKPPPDEKQCKGEKVADPLPAGGSPR